MKNRQLRLRPAARFRVIVFRGESSQNCSLTPRHPLHVAGLFPSMSPHSRVFTSDDQLAFARLSGDYNPIHLDPVAARRLLFGQPVVHGVHALLWAFDGWLADQSTAVRVAGPVRITKLKVRFRSSIPLDARIELVARQKSPTEVQLELSTDDAKAVTASVSFEPAGESSTRVVAEFPPQGPCRDRGPAELATMAGEISLCLERKAATTLFPHAVRCLPADQLATLLAATRVVGMEAPGLHSIFSGLELEAGSVAEKAAPVLRYETANFDDRVSRLELRVDSSGMRGQVLAFVRPEPQQQASFESLQSLVAPNEFAGERALVIGGSRGLGEVAVKLLAAGGAEVRFTYARGAADAERLAAEIAIAKGHVASFQYDVLADPPRLAAALENWSPTLLCFFATPHIAASPDGGFSASRFGAFCDYYIRGFLATFEAARACGPGLSRVLYPSSVFVEELPPNLGEYAAAKTAAEALCRFLAKAHGGIRFHCPRWPRLATDQTASLIRTELPDPAATVFAALRDVLQK
jgi:NAD(P)-dependent dehydrogenase (short-subunit alcohol dehydrogenase family)